MERAWTWLLVVWASALAPGCSERACMQWSDSDGACPTPDEALAFMRGGDGASTCGTPRVISVDGEGDFDGHACCYDVTESDDGVDGEIICDVGAAGPTPGTSVAVTSGSSSSGFCGDGFCDGSIGESCTSCSDCGACGCNVGSDACVGCGELVTASAGACTELDLCAVSAPLFDALVSCGCASCAACQDNLCSPASGTADTACGRCVAGTCVAELQTCQNDVSR